MLRKTIIAAAICLSGTGVLAQSHSDCYAYPSTVTAQKIDSSGITCSFPGGGDRSEDQAFVGVVLTFDKGAVHPKISAGLRRILVQGNDQVKGAEINFSTAPTDLTQTTLRVLGLTGKRDVMANIGFGYDLADQSILVNGGVQVPYLRAFVDYKPKDGVIIPQIEINSYGKIAPAGAGCNGDVLSRSQILSQLIESNILVYNGDALSYLGNLYDGYVSEPGGFSAILFDNQNFAVFNAEENTCLTVPDGTVIDLYVENSPT